MRRFVDCEMSPWIFVSQAGRFGSLHYGAMTPRHKPFPPGRGNLLIPTSTKAAALAGIAMYSPSSTRGTLAHRAVWYSVGLLGARGLPGRSVSTLPLPQTAWGELRDAWRRELGEFDDWALHRPPDSHRDGLGVLLLRRGRPVAFVKVRKGGDCAALHRESAALRLVEKANPQSFRFSKALFQGSVTGWAFAGFAPLPTDLHHPPSDPPLAAILEEIREALATLPRSQATPAHWLPMHGDFTPWNLRRLRRHLYLLDWETAGWGPPGADEVMYRSTAVVMRLESPDTYRKAAPEYPEAVRYWRAHWQRKIDRHTPPGDAPPEKALAVQLVNVLESE